MNQSDTFHFGMRKTNVLANNGKISVLIVDDVKTTQEHLSILLSFAEDVEVVGTAANGLEALLLTKALQPDIVLMDINMPAVGNITDGIMATEMIVKEKLPTQVIMMSAQNEVNYLQRSWQAGAREFLLKPFSRSSLLKSIRRVYQLSEVSQTEAKLRSLEELQLLRRVTSYKQSIILGHTLDKLERITWGIPHDLKEPLGIARNILDNVSEILPPPFKNEDIIYCRCKFDYAMLLISRFIVLTSPGVLEVSTDNSLTETLDTVVRLIKANHPSAPDIEVNIRLDDLKVQTEPLDLQQIILCLLGNAIETDTTGHTIQVVVDGDAANCSLTVIDARSDISGPTGMLYDLISTPKAGYAGIGLYVCQQITRWYSGEISLSKRKRQSGTVATVVLPRKFQRKVTQHDLVDLKKALQQYLKHPLTIQEEEIVHCTLNQILTTFVNQLSSIINSLEVFLSPKVKQIAQQNNQAHAQLFQTLLDNCAYARSVAGSLLDPPFSITPQVIHLKTILLEVLQLFSTKLSEQSVNLKVDDQIWVEADQTQLQRVFFNLIRNAIEAMRKQGEFALQVEGRMVNDFALIRFADSGVGIPEKCLKKIFDRGFSTKHKGRGLGLFVTKTIVERHQGQITVQSTQGKGATFTIYWPLAAQSLCDTVDSLAGQALTGQMLIKTNNGAKMTTDRIFNVETSIPSSLTAKLSEFESRPTSTDRKTDIMSPEHPQILIVEDDSLWLNLLTRHLRSEHYTTHTTRKVGEAIELIESNCYALILLDWRMPGLKGGGQDILETIQVSKHNIPIVVLSAYSIPEQKTRALQLGAKAFLDKPHDKEQWDVLKQTVFEIVVGN